MENKKLGTLFIIISLVFGMFLLYFNSSLSEQRVDNGCVVSDECEKISNSLGIMHLAFGFFGFMLALGFYLIFFNKTEAIIMKKLEDGKESEKFDFALRFLDSNEKKIIKIIKEQDGITQNTLRLRSDMSKTKLSYVLQDLEKRGVIKRAKKGRTLSVHLQI